MATVGLKLDEKRLTPEQRDKLENYNMSKKQLDTLNDIADIAQELLNTMDGQNDDSHKKTQDIGALLMDMREALNAIKNKEAPEAPDYAKPVVAAVDNLEKALTKAISKIELSPKIKVDAPSVKVDAPVVDLTGVEKAMEGLPKAFKDAVKLIPETQPTDLNPLLEKLDTLSTQLESIDTATRIKPQFPNTIKVTNPDGSAISSQLSPGVDYDYVDVQQTDTDTETYVFKTGGSGGTTVRTITVNYTDATKQDVDNVAWA